jgi:protease I
VKEEMENVRVDGMSVAILLGDNFEHVEMTEPHKALEAAGARATLISPVPGQIYGVAHDRDLRKLWPCGSPCDAKFM